MTKNQEYLVKSGRSNLSTVSIVLTTQIFINYLSPETGFIKTLIAFYSNTNIVC